MMDYLDDIDIAEFREIPTYKRMCLCILRNDYACKYMGFAVSKEEKKMKDYIYNNIRRYGHRRKGKSGLPCKGGAG